MQQCACEGEAEPLGAWMRAVRLTIVDRAGMGSYDRVRNATRTVALIILSSGTTGVVALISNVWER